MFFVVVFSAHINKDIWVLVNVTYVWRILYELFERHYKALNSFHCTSG